MEINEFYILIFYKEGFKSVTVMNEKMFNTYVIGLFQIRAVIKLSVWGYGWATEHTFALLSTTYMGAKHETFL